MTARVTVLLYGYSFSSAEEGSLGFCGVYLVEAPGPWRLVFDTGHAGRRRALERALAGHDLTPASIDAVLLWETITPYINMRTVFLDLAVNRSAAFCPQIVMLGAGMDSRAFRLGLSPSTTVFEVDKPPVLAYKQRMRDQLCAAS